MNCNQCIKVNAIAQCVLEDGDILLSGLAFSENVSEELQGRLINIATGKIHHFLITTNGSGEVIETDGVATSGIDLTDAYPLMNHVYELRFFSDGIPVPFTLTNPDSTTTEGCCIEFETINGLSADGEIPLTTTTCAV